VADGTTRSGSVGRATLAWQEYGLCIDSPLSAVTAARAVGGQCAFRGIAWLATSDVTQRDGLQDETSFPERRAAAKQGGELSRCGNGIAGRREWHPAKLRKGDGNHLNDAPQQSDFFGIAYPLSPQ
jgi:hypothetical protein